MPTQKSRPKALRSGMPLAGEPATLDARHNPVGDSHQSEPFQFVVDQADRVQEWQCNEAGHGRNSVNCRLRQETEGNKNAHEEEKTPACYAGRGR